MQAHVKKGESVVAMSGREKGKRGRVLEVLGEKGRVRVEGLMTIKRHLKRGRSTAAPEGGIVEKFGTVAISNVLPLCTKCDRGVRVARKRDAEGKAFRACRRCGERIGT